MLRHIAMMYLAAACIATPHGFCDAYGYFISDGLHCWDMDKPDSKVVWSVPLQGPGCDLHVTPDRQHVVVIIDANKIEGLSPWDDVHKQRVGAYVLVDVCNPSAAKTFRIPAAKSFNAGPAISADGRLLYVQGNPEDDSCQDEYFRDHTFTSACFVIDIATGALLNTFCTLGILIGPNDRVYYLQYYSNVCPAPLMSRTALGQDERTELQIVPRFEGGGFGDVFGLHDQTWLVFTEGYATPAAAFTVYTLDAPNVLTLKFKHAGEYRGVEGDCIRYRVGHNQGLVECRNPQNDQVRLDEVAANPPPDGPPLGQLVVSPDGKKHYYIDDHGLREPLDIVSYSLETKMWSEKYSTPFNGGEPGGVLLNDPCPKISSSPTPTATEGKKIEETGNK